MWVAALLLMAGDPFTTGRHTSPVTGYMYGADHYIGPDKSIPPALEIHVSQPTPNSTIFPQFQIGLEGTVRDFDPPHSYWALANPPVSNSHPLHHTHRNITDDACSPHVSPHLTSSLCAAVGL